MYLSCLLIDVGDDPDRPRPGRLWLRNLYRVHQRLCMAFPTAPQRQKDPEFLMPYQPCGFQDPRPERCTIGTDTAAPPRPCGVAAVERPIHVPRDPEHNFLFRIDDRQPGGGCVDPHPAGRVVILVQSAMEPDWGYAFHNASYLVAQDVKRFDPCFAKEERLRFRLVANPTRRIAKTLEMPPASNPTSGGYRPRVVRYSCGHEGRYDLWPEGATTPEKDADYLAREAKKRCPKCTCLTVAEPSGPDGRRRNGKRVPVPPSQLVEWLAGRAEAAGFSIDKDLLTVQPGYIYVNDPERQEPEAPSSQKGKGYRLFSVRYDGVLTITDSARFQETLVRGIGPGKAFGLGLLSVAPAAVPASAP
jgi:hypothetical protein